MNRDMTKIVPVSLATAAVVIWQNSRLAVLWDVSYILENATRMAQGQMAYRDFPFPYAPLTFLAQAAIIRLFGRHYFLHIAYSAIAAAFATALTYAIVRRQGVRPAVAFILCAPLAPLGIYCILPHPFYDPDACLFVLIAILLYASSREGARRYTFGLLAVVPLFIKQNIGLPFLAAAILILIIERDRKALFAAATALILAIATISMTAGLQNYIRWTIEFAAQRRLPPLAQYVSMFNDSTLWWWLAAGIAGVLLSMKWRMTGLLIATIPWIWSAVRFFITDDPVEPEVNFLRFWALMIVLVWFRRPAALQVLIVAAILGAFLSQQAWGSTYGIWPLLIILIAITFNESIIAATIISAVLLLHAVPYVINNNRLVYAKVNEGATQRSSLAPLRGLTVRGPYLPDFEELVAWTDKNIPRDDAILCLPGEDLFYFSTGRSPRVPVLMFDRTINPYSARQIASWPVRWIIVKRNLQINGTPMEELPEVLRLTNPAPAIRLRSYDVYRR
jgi:hypothetical protein